MCNINVIFLGVMMYVKSIMILDFILQPKEKLLLIILACVYGFLQFKLGLKINFVDFFVRLNC
jgi:hypothetical protein